MDDVAMIELERDFELTGKLQPACLPEKEMDYTGMQCFIGMFLTVLFCFIKTFITSGLGNVNSRNARHPNASS